MGSVEGLLSYNDDDRAARRRALGKSSYCDMEGVTMTLCGLIVVQE